MEPVSGLTNVYDLTRADDPVETGTPLNAATILTDSVAAKYGFAGDNAIPDKVFNALASFLLSGGSTSLTVLDEDGSPISGVQIQGVTTPSGAAASTDAEGKAVVSVTADVSVTLVSPYADIPNKTVTLTPNFSEVNAITVNMPYVEAGTVSVIKESGTIKFKKSRTVNMSLVGGGTGGQRGQDGGRGTSSSEKVAYGGNGGSGGKILNLTNQAVSGEYELVVGAGGVGVAYGATQNAGGDTTLGDWSSASGAANATAVGSVSAGGAGGAGGDGAGSSSTRATAGRAGSRQGGAGGAGDGYASGGVYQSKYGTSGGFGGGGGGGGGGESFYYMSDSSPTSGGSAGNGGAGGLVIVF